MDNAMNNNYYYGQQAVGQPYYGYDPNMYGYNAMGYANIPTPANQNALTGEEIQILKNARPTSKIDLAIDRNDVLRSMCTHKDNGRDVVVQVNDGSGNVYCPICQRTWKPDMKSKEEVEELVSELLDQMENAKWTGDLPVDVTRELFTLMPLLKKYPQIHEFAMNTFNKYYSARGMYNAQDTNIYGMYNSLFGAGAPVGGYMGTPMQGYYGQQQQSTNQGYYGWPNQGYTPTTTQANPMINPMQAPVYGVNPTAPNQQFVQQANTMMGGTVYGQPTMYNTPVMNQPVYGNPVAQQNQQVVQQTNQQQNANQQDVGPMVGPSSDSVESKKSKIDL